MATAAAAAKRKRKSKSVLKRVRQTARRTAINRAGKSHLRTQVKRFRQALVAGNLAQARELLQPTLTLLDRPLRKKNLHPHTPPPHQPPPPPQAPAGAAPKTAGESRVRPRRPRATPPPRPPRAGAGFGCKIFFRM